MNTILRILIPFLLSVPSAQASGIRLEDVYQRALKQNENVAVQQQVIEQAEARIDQAFAPLLPQLSATASVALQERSANPLVQQIWPSEQQTLRFTVSQSLFRGLKDRSNLERAKLTRQSQTSTLAESKRRLYETVAETFYEILSLESDLQILREEVELNQKLLKQTQGYVKSGQAKRSEALNIESNIASLQGQISGLNGRLLGYREALFLLSGVDRKAPLLAEPLNENLELAELLSGGGRRPDLKSAKLDAEAAALTFSGVRGGHLPSLDLQGNYYVNRPGALSDISWDAQLVLTLPIYSGGLVQSQMREAAAEHLVRQIQLGRKQREVEQDIRMLFEAWKGQQEQVHSLKTVSRLSREAFSSVQSEFRSGTASNANVLLAQAGMQQAKRALAKSEYESQLTLIKLRLAANQINFEE